MKKRSARCFVSTSCVFLMAVGLTGAQLGLGDDPAQFDQRIESAWQSRDLSFLEANLTGDARYSSSGTADQSKEQWLTIIERSSGAGRTVLRSKSGAMDRRWLRLGASVLPPAHNRTPTFGSVSCGVPEWAAGIRSVGRFARRSVPRRSAERADRRTFIRCQGLPPEQRCFRHRDWFTWHPVPPMPCVPASKEVVVEFIVKPDGTVRRFVFSVARRILDS